MAGRAFVLGSSSGLGKHIVAHLRSTGWVVTGVSRHPAHEDDLALDLTAEGAADHLMGRLKAATPALVVNCAVVYPDSDSTTNPGELVRGVQQQFLVNASVPYAAMDGWIREAGTLVPCTYVHCSSDSVYSVQPTSAGYPATKLAAHALVNALAKLARGTNFAVSILLLGPLATPRKVGELERIAAARQWSAERTTELYLSRANPEYVQDTLIALDTCASAVIFLQSLGPQANGTLMRLDGGSGGARV
mgnify:CR=1 FL=1